MNPVALSEIVGGALQEQFNSSFVKVVQNMQDPNTPYKDKREICIKLKFQQNVLRDDVKCNIQATEKLAPHSAMETAFYIGKDLSSGEVYVEEYGKQLKGQVSMDVPVDEETGEVLEPEKTNVVNLRETATR